jgi:hypothetical protein
MNLNNLKETLIKMKINPLYYSLNEGLKSDSLILTINYNKWEVFYMDERGNKHDELIFNNENDACVYIYNRFYEIELMKKQFPKKNQNKENNDLPNIINL